MNAVWGLIGIGIVIAMVGGIMTSLDDATSDSRIDVFGVTTNTSTTTVTLQETPFQSLTSSITLISSNVATDHPLAQTISGKTLAITGLDADTSGSRALTVNYKYGNMSGYAGGDTMPNLTPLVLWLGIIIVIVGIGVMIFQRRRG